MSDLRQALISAGFRSDFEEVPRKELPHRMPACAADAVIVQYLGPRAALLGRPRKNTISALMYSTRGTPDVVEKSQSDRAGMESEANS